MSEKPTKAELYAAARLRQCAEHKAVFADALQVAIGGIEGLTSRLQGLQGNLEGYLEDGDPVLLGLEIRFTQEEQGALTAILEAMNKAHRAAEAYRALTNQAEREAGE